MEATQELAKAAERAGIRTFLYTSTICVYGSPKRWNVSEDCPLISIKPGAQNNYLTNRMLREYARTKLLGEYAIKEYVKNVFYVIIRPCSIVSDHDILGVLECDIFTRIWRGYRVTHHVYVDDVVAAMIYLVELNYQNNSVSQQKFEVYQISNDDDPENYFHVMFSKAHKKMRNVKYWLPFYAPSILDSVKDIIKYHNMEAKYSLGMIKYLPGRLYATGFRYPTGISSGHNKIIDKMDKYT